MGDLPRRVRSFLLLGAALALGHPATAQPRPLNLTHLVPMSQLSVGTHFAEIDGSSALGVPLGLQLQLSRQTQLLFDAPFGYLNEPGNPAAPVVGNLGVGGRLTGNWRLRRRDAFLWAVTLSGRAPTAPGEDAATPTPTLRWVGPYHGERWSPRQGSVRLDLAGGPRLGKLAIQAEVGAVVHLPLDETEASLGFHWGILASALAFDRAVLMLELSGTDLAPGLGGQSEGHLVSLVPGFRLVFPGAAPGFFVSIPVAGPTGPAPVVFGLDLAAF